MSKIILVCYRKPFLPYSDPSGKLSEICNHILPENIVPNPPEIIRQDRISIALANPAPTVETHPEGICMGVMYGENSNWWEIGRKIPEGNFSLFRYNQSHLEIATDIVGSRHLWYYMDEKIFIASSSQRAIIQYLESFEPNPEAFSWMLATGFLIQGVSWDKRIKRLPVNTLLTLNHQTWERSQKQFSFETDIPPGSKKNHQKAFIQTMKEYLGSIQFAPKDWLLPLSGGFDSRALLLFMRGAKKLGTITWSAPQAQENPFSDVQVAKKLAQHYGLSHRIIPVSQNVDSLEVVLDRFIRNSEGLTDNFSGYLDGFQLWKKLFEMGFSGYVRGDRPFFTRPQRGADDIIYCLNISPLSFYENGAFYEEKMGIIGPEIPDSLRRKEGESLPKWKNRLIISHFAPCILASLAECKSGFLEVANPLLGKSIVEYVYSVSDELEVVHDIYRQTIKKASPGVPIASENANVSMGDIIHSRDLVDFMKKTFSETESREVFSDEFLDYLTDSIQVKGNTLKETAPRTVNGFHAWVKNKIPKHLRKRKYVGKKTYKLKNNRVAFRAMIVIKTVELLHKDAKRLELIQN